MYVYNIYIRVGRGCAWMAVTSWMPWCQSIQSFDDVTWYRGTSLIRNRPRLGPYSRTMPKALWWSKGGGGCFL